MISQPNNGQAILVEPLCPSPLGEGEGSTSLSKKAPVRRQTKKSADLSSPAHLPPGVEGFNLVDEPWIPLSDNTKVSLSQAFSESLPKAQLAGTPVEKIAVMKLLIAIANSAVLPRDKKAWVDMGPAGLSRDALDYLELHRNKFFLTGDRPFLQMKGVKPAKVAGWSSLNPQYASGNATVLTQWQQSSVPSAPQVAMLLVVLSSFALGGKKTDNAVVLTPGYGGKRNPKGKPSTSRPGPGVEFLGLLHSFFWSDRLLETVWLNMFTEEDLDSVSPLFPGGLGIPPWEDMPTGEDDPRARSLRSSLMGRLVSLSRFCLLHPEGMHYSEGLPHRSYLEGVADPSATMTFNAKKNTALWANPSRRPWRELPALLSLLSGRQEGGMRCFGIDRSLEKVVHQSVVQTAGVWSGGMRVKSNAGEQYLSISEDMVESCLWLDIQVLGEMWFEIFSGQMLELDGLSKKLYGAIKRYGDLLGRQEDGVMAQATAVFWQLAERHAQALVEACANLSSRDSGVSAKGAQGLADIRAGFSNILASVYDRFCPNSTARQMEAWARARPETLDYLRKSPAITLLSEPSNNDPEKPHDQ